MHSCTTCLICGRALRSTRDCKSCIVCKKYAHSECDSDMLMDTFSGSSYTCINCRKSPLVGGDAIMPCVAAENANNFLETDEEEVEEELSFMVRSSTTATTSSTEMRNSSASTLMPTKRSKRQRRFSPSPSRNIFSASTSFSGNSSPIATTTSGGYGGGGPSLDDFLVAETGVGNAALFTSGMSSPIATGTEEESCSTRDESPQIQNDPNMCSDNDEYKPPSSRRACTTTENQAAARGSRNHGKKKPGISRQQTSSMRTRSGGQPTHTSYAHIGFEIKDEKIENIGVQQRGKRGRGGPNKGNGKGGARGRKTGGRGSKFSSMSYFYGSTGSSSTAGGASNSGPSNQSVSKGDGDEMQRGVQQDKTELNGGEKKASSSVNDENDYIRTAIVTNANDKFMSTISLCLICGSVGKDVEGTMISCTSCAQSYHTYCVGMHDKINSTVLKRGWRCLECTVCEGCGSGKDESNLLLCDECDISYHIYCLDPPLETIPGGSWRCKWCAMCCRCNKQVQSGLDLQRLEGLCETCYSLRKCMKCSRLYELGDLLIKCQRCIRWFHSKCEDLLTEEQAENAAENAFRCSLCRPQLGNFNNDLMNMSVIIDNVMVNKSAADYIQQQLRKTNQAYSSGPQQPFDPISGGLQPRSHSYEHDDSELMEDFDPLSYMGGNGRGRGSGGRGGGPGRRVLKIGVGGFNVKIPRHRLLAVNNDEENCQSPNVMEDEAMGLTQNGKPRIRRPRKPRRPQLEDAYPAPIQESFFGFAAVDSRSLVEQVVDEPVLGEFNKSSLDYLSNKAGCELTERSAEALRTEQEQDMLGDIFDENIDFDIDNLDLNYLMDDDDVNDDVEDSINDNFSVTGSSGLITGMCSPSTSAVNDFGGVMENGSVCGDGVQISQNVNKLDGSFHHLQMQQDDLRKRQQQMQARLTMGAVVQRSNSQHSDLNAAVERVNLATERWEEDEPLGDKATKAAVLYANLCHPDFKKSYPIWTERVKMINRVWRMLDGDKRGEYVDMARKNRANSAAPRRRTRRAHSSVLTGAPTVINNTAQPLGLVERDSTPASTNDLINANVTAIKQHAQQVVQMGSGVNPNEFSENFKVPMVPKDNLNSVENSASATANPGAAVQPQNFARVPNFSENPQTYLKSGFPLQQILQQTQQQQQPSQQLAQQPRQLQQQGFVPPQVPNHMATINQQQLAMEQFVIEEHKMLKKQFFELQREQQIFEADLNRLRKMKKSVSAKHRLLSKNQIRAVEEGLNPHMALMGGGGGLDSEINEAFRIVDDTKKGIQVTLKQLDKNKQKLRDSELRLQNFEGKYEGVLNKIHQNLQAGLIPHAQFPLNASIQNNNIFMRASNGHPNTPNNLANTTNNNALGLVPHSPNNPGTSFSSRGAPLQGVYQQPQVGFVNSNPSGSVSAISAQKAARLTEMDVNNSMGSGPPTPNSGGSMGGSLIKPGSAASSLTNSSTFNTLLEQRGRGRKRKKLHLEDMPRSSFLGGIAYNSLQNPEDREVYEVVDRLVNCIVLNNTNGEALTVRRILNTQAPLVMGTNNGENAYSQNHDQYVEFPKIKKKRQQYRKHNGNNEPNEYELVMERIHSQLEMVPHPKRSLDQYFTFDHIIPYTDLALPERSGSEMGKYSFNFMPDYYEKIGVAEEFDESQLYPKSMVELCSGVNMTALLANDDYYMDTKLFEKKEALPRQNNPNEIYEIKPDLAHLSLISLDERAQIPSSGILLGPKIPEITPPMAPHRSQFFKKVEDSNRELKVSLIVDSAEMYGNPVDLINHLKQILNIKQQITLEMETPPQSPNFNENMDSENISNLNIKMEITGDEMSTISINEEYSRRMHGSTTTSKPGRRCRNCEHAIMEQINGPIEDTMSRLGLTPPDEKDDTVAFCSMACYYKFMVTCKVPLGVELLDRAEKYVDDETIEKLRQISADSFAKKIHQGQFNSEHRNDLRTSFLSPNKLARNFSKADSENLLQQNQNSAETELAILEAMRQPREQIIRASELSNLMQNIENKNQTTKGEYKWKGHSWMVADFNLIQSFQRPQDDVRQKCASIHLQVHERSRVSRADDTRNCVLCGESGDGEQELSGRLLNVDANEWVHVNCALWSSEVHEAENGALLNVEAAIQRAKTTKCRLCGGVGASLRCYKLECITNLIVGSGSPIGFHLKCAKKANGSFVRDKTFYCQEHEIRPDMRVNRLDALRRVYIQREENQLLAKIFNHSYPTEMMMRVGSLIFHKIGQLLPEQLKTFHNENYIFPIGYRITRIFWSPNNPLERTRFECSVAEQNNNPEFVVSFDARELRDKTPGGAWNRVLLSVMQSREKVGNLLKFFPNQMGGEALFGFLEPAITKMIESLPGVDQLYTYTFKHGGSPLMDLPLAVNPSGCARCEPCFRTLIKRRFKPLISTSPKKPLVGSAQRSNHNNFGTEVISREARSTRSCSSRFSNNRIDQETLRAYKAVGISEEMLSRCGADNSQQSQHQAYIQYKRMQKEWPNTVYLARSKIQGLGLYAKRDIDMNSMIIEYMGEVIRSEVGDVREKRYVAQNRGVYMFRIDEELLIDATLAGGLARYINHSCDPNCSTRILQYNDEKKIIITANRPIKAEEELTYDYQFELEDTEEKLPCLCGAPNCNKWMN